MRPTLLDMAHRLSDQDLIRQLRRLASHERTATVELVAHLAELDTRRLHLPLGFGSLFAYSRKSCIWPSTPRTTGSKRRVRLGGSL